MHGEHLHIDVFFIKETMANYGRTFNGTSDCLAVYRESTS